MEMGLICGDCNMVFHSISLLEKHKALFCIGSEVGSVRVQRHTSDTVMRNNAGGMDPKQMRTPDLVQTRNQPRSIGRWRSVDAEPKSGRTEDKPMASQTNSALQILIDEFHKLRTSIEQNLPNWSKGITDTEVNRHQLGHSEKLKHMREMAALHEHQLALIHAHNQQLEQQRDELAHQVSVLSEQSSTTHLEILLMELREQEQRNEETLQHLAEHLRTLHEQQVSAPANKTGPHKNEKIYHHNFELISVDGPLSTQIRALRQAYMQSGGSDPSIVAQMIDLQAEAQSLEKNQPTAATKAKKKKINSPQRSLSWELLAVEQQNQRLEEEILRIQLARGRHQDYEAALTPELELIQMDTLQQITGLQAEMEKSKEAQMPRRPHPLPPHPFPRQSKSHIHAPLSLLPLRASRSPLGRCMMDLMDSLGPAPYDPVAGFVVFFDLVTGVDVSQKALRLVAALYSDSHEVGTLTSTSTVQCLTGASPPYLHSLENYALLSVKLPVLRTHPSPSLCLVVEVQAAGDLHVSNLEDFKLVSCGWTQLELFDEYNQLRSGYWKMPVRSLPIRPTLSLVQLNTIPQVGNMEVCIRLVNGRDGDAQSLAKPDLTCTRLYKYPAVVSSLPIHGNVVLPGSVQESTVERLSLLLPFIEPKGRPPPSDEASQN